LARSGDNPALGGITAAITLVVAVTFGQVLMLGRTFASATYLEEVVPALSYAGERIAMLELPEWWQGIGLGVPFAGNPDHPVFYPPVWLLGWLPDLAAADALMLGHAALLGVGVALLARRLGSAPAETLLAGGAAVASGATTGAIATGALLPLAWTPWALVAAARLGAAGGRAGRARGALLVAVTVAVQLYAGRLEIAAVTACAVVGLAVTAAPARRLEVAGWALLGCVMAALAAAAVLVPALFANLAPSSLAAPVGAGGVAGAVWPSGGAYVGPALVLLALLAMRRRELVPVGAIAAVGVAVAGLGYGAALAPALVVVIALAGVGAGELRASPPAAAVAAGAAVAVGCAAGGFAAGELVVGAGLAATAAVAVALARRPDREAALAPILAAVVVGPLIAVSWSALPRIDRSDFAAAPALAAGPLERREPGAPPPRILRPPLAQVDRADVDRATALALAHRTAAPNAVARFGGAQIRGRDRAADPRVVRAYRAAALASDRFLDLYAVDFVVLPRSVVTAANMPVVVDDPVNGAALVDNDVRRPPAFVAARWRWYTDDDSLLADLFPDAVGGPRGLPMATVRLSGAGVDGGVDEPRPARPCAVDRRSPEEVAVRCRAAEQSSYAVLLDAPAAGWSATVDGASRRIERADLLARAVAIEPGEREVVFRYRTPGLRLGAIIAGLAWLNLLALAWIVRRR
jgi:hypothetical protein